ncbi:MAG: glutathione S-transferase, partial [Alphaproteobacteria bacterium]
MADKPVLYGRATSANVQKVMWIFHELETDYDRVDAGGPFGKLDTPSYIALNPNQLVPTLVDGDVKLWESHAIVRYIAVTLGGGRMWVADPVRRATVDQWTDWSASTFQPAWMGVFMQAYLIKKERRSAEALAAALGKAERL